MSSNHDQPSCGDVDDAMADVLDGTASDAVINHLVSCDRCRDARHEAETARDLAEDAGADYVPPSDLTSRLMATLDERERRHAAVPISTLLPTAAEAEAATLVIHHPLSIGGGLTDRIRRLFPAATKKRRRIFIAAFAATLSVIAVATFVLALRRQNASPEFLPFSGTVGLVARAGKDGDGGLSICKGAKDPCRPMRQGDVIAPGDRVRTDERTRTRLDLGDGSVFVLDRDTEVEFAPKSIRTAKITRGLASLKVSGASKKDAPHVTIQLPHATVDAASTALTVTATETMSLVEVTRGEVAIHSDADSNGARKEPTVVRAGHEGRVLASASGARTIVAPSSTLESDELPSSDLGSRKVEDGGKDDVIRGIGQLRAKKPGEAKERDHGIRLAKHHVKVRIAGNMARTEIEESFANESADELEGIYRMPLPPDAQIERLALEVNGKLEDGAFVARDKAKAIWGGVIKHAAPEGGAPKEPNQPDIVWVPGPWRDPALLEWQRGGRFELRIFPIPAHGARRVVLAYTQNLALHSGLRRYTYPLAYDPSGSTTIDDFDVDVRIVGHDKSFGVIPRGYTMDHASGTGDQPAEEQLHMNARAFVPAGDLALEYTVTSDASELTAWSYLPPGGTLAGDREAYVAMAIRPKLPAFEEHKDRVYAIVVDSSRSMFGERYKRASSIAAAFIRDLDKRDQAIVFACNTECRAVTELSAIQPDGAHDAAFAIQSALTQAAASASASGKKLHVVYLGDGGVSAGSLRSERIAKMIEPIASKNEATITSIAIGSDADTSMLASIARAGGGTVVRDGGQPPNVLAAAALSATRGAVLKHPVLRLPAGLHAVAPEAEHIDTIAEGGEVFIVARVDQALDNAVKGTIELDGEVGGEKYHQTYPLDVRMSASAGNAFVPRLYASLRIADLERTKGESAKDEIVRLSREQFVASRFTSLLVLESEAMFRAYGLDRGGKSIGNTSGGGGWTGEDVSDKANADGDVPQPKPPLPVPSAAHVATRPSVPPGLPSTRNSCDVPFTIDATGRRKYKVECLSDSPPPRPPPTQPPAGKRGFVPMQRTFVRHGAFSATAPATPAADELRIATAETALAKEPNNRAKTSNLVRAYAGAGRIEAASDRVRDWLIRDPLDADALLLRSELAARMGDRNEELLSLAGIVDLDANDTRAQLRLSRTYEALGDARRACAHRVSAAESSIASSQKLDLDLLASAVRCARANDLAVLADDLLLATSSSSVTDDQRKKLDLAITAAPPASTPPLKGDVLINATWDAAVDLDIALVEVNLGRRYAWSNTAAANANVTAGVHDANSLARESVAWANLPVGTYAIEVTTVTGASSGSTPTVRGTIDGKAVDRTVSKTPFTTTGARTAIGTITITREERLTPVATPWTREDNLRGWRNDGF